MHTESGARATERDLRAAQLRHLSRQYESDIAQTYIVAGDLNLREGDDQCLLSEGWRDAWTLKPIEVGQRRQEWTWKFGDHTGRYDRAYIRGPCAANAKCVRVEVLDNVRGALTDHAALRVEFRYEEAAAVPRPAPRRSGAHVIASASSSSGGAPGAVATAVPLPRPDAAATARSVSSQPPALACKQRDDVRVVELANKVAVAVKEFRAIAAVCLDLRADPSHMKLDKGDILIEWSSLPEQCGFKVKQARRDGKPHRVTGNERSDMITVYAKYAMWAGQCGVDDATWRQILQKADAKKFGTVPLVSDDAGVPGWMRERKVDPGTHRSEVQRSYAVSLCRLEGLTRAARSAGRTLGGDLCEEAAALEMARLVEASDAERADALRGIPVTWRGVSGLRLNSAGVEGCQRIPGLFEYWLRKESARLMGAASRWNELIHECTSGADTNVVASILKSVPEFFTLDGVAFSQGLPSYLNTQMLRVGKAPLAGAWWLFSWRSACDEVALRYSFDASAARPCGHVSLRKCGVQLTVVELYKRIFERPADINDEKKRLQELEELYVSLDLLLSTKRKQQDHGHVLMYLKKGKQDKKTLSYLWDDLVKALSPSTPWTAWTPSPDFPAPVTLEPTTKTPPYLLISEVTPDMVSDCGAGSYKWGDIRVDNAKDKVTAAEEITKEWCERSSRKLQVLDMTQRKSAARAALICADQQLRPGQPKVSCCEYSKLL